VELVGGGEFFSIDFQARDYKIIETVDDDTLWDVCDIVKGSVFLNHLTNQQKFLLVC